MSLFTVLFVIFLVLKLTGVIAWGWFWVFLPLAIQILILTAFAIMEEWQKRYREKAKKDRMRRYNGS